MTQVFITQEAEQDVVDMMFAIRTPQGQEKFRKEIYDKIGFLEDGVRLGRPFAAGGPTAREVVLRKGQILMRYDEQKAGVVEIFEFLFSRNNH